MEFFHRLYEGQVLRWLPAPYKGNPCDVGAALFFKRLAPFFEALVSHCPCCTGARILLAALIGALFPKSMLLALGIYATIAMAVAAMAVLARAMTGEAEPPGPSGGSRGGSASEDEK